MKGLIRLGGAAAAAAMLVTTALLAPATAAPRTYLTKQTSSIASAAGALAAINGDFTNDGMPVHAFAEEGALKTAGVNVGGTFAISKDEANEYLKSGVKPVVKVVNTPAGKTFTVEQWNSD